MSSPQVRIFISHSWQHGGHYSTLIGWVRGKPWRWGQAVPEFLDYSVPKDDPIHNAPSARLLKEEIRKRMAYCHVVVIPTGMYSTYSKWIKIEIDLAREMGKPVLGVNPWAQQRRSGVVQQAANEVVGWTQKSVLNGIWRQFQGAWR